MVEVKFYDNVADELLKFAVIISKTDNKWVFCKHKERETYEVPGGHREPGESILETAKRELQEETGYSAGNLIKLGTVNPNPALFSNHVHIFLAENLTPTGIQHLDNDEFIDYIELSKDEVLQGMGTEQFPHAIMGTALCLYLKHKSIHF